MYLIKTKQKQTLPNFYSTFIICWIYSVFHHRPSNLISKDWHIYYVCTVISARNTCMPGSQPKIIKIFQTEFQKLKLLDLLELCKISYWATQYAACHHNRKNQTCPFHKYLRTS